MNPTTATTDPAPTLAPTSWVLLPLEARARGFRNTLSFRRWCRRRGVALRKDGKLLWVCPSDVDRAVCAIGVAPPPANAREAAERAAAEAAARIVTRGGG